MNRPAHARSISRRLLLAGLFAGAAVLILPRETAAQNYRTILDAGESQTPQGVRGADGADVLLACSYTISGSLLYTGPLSGTGGTWSQINVPSASTSGTVANTIPHSVMGSIAVGNYNLVAGGSSAALGNAFVYNIATDA